MVGDINYIVVIESLDNERLTGKELYDDCITRNIAYRKSPIKPQYFKVGTKEDLTNILKYYEANSKYMPGGTLIHFEMHGDINNRGLILADGAMILWEELADLFRPININTCNKLYISLATCFGRYLYLGVKPEKKSPFSCYISASKAVYPSEIVDDYTTLFTELIESGNLVSTYRKMAEQITSFYYKDSERVFEDNFEAVRNSPSIRDEMRDNVIRDCERLGVDIVTEVNIDDFLEKAFNDLYNEQKRAFDFSDCE